MRFFVEATSRRLLAGTGVGAALDVQECDEDVLVYERWSYKGIKKPAS
jgi:hypothetical protein